MFGKKTDLGNSLMFVGRRSIGSVLLILSNRDSPLQAARQNLLIVGPVLRERNGLRETDGERFDRLVKDQNFAGESMQ